MISKTLDRIMKEYRGASAGPIKDSDFAKWMRREVREQFEQEFRAYPNLKWKASPGTGNRWADSPWIGARDPSVAESFQKGYCIGYVFSASLNTCYLSMQIGTVELTTQFGEAKARRIIRRRKEKILRSVTPDYKKRFNNKPIELEATKPSSLNASYQEAHVFGKEFKRRVLPTEQELKYDLTQMLELYQVAIRKVGKFPESG